VSPVSLFLVILQVGSIIHTFPVIDRDASLNSLFRCSFLHDPDHTFSIITNYSPFSFSGNCSLSLTRPLNYEARPNYRVVVLVRDFGHPSKSTLAAVIVAVENEVDSAPRFNQSLYSIPVQQPTPVNSTIATFTAIASESLPLHQLYYRLVFPGMMAANFFRVDQVSGELVQTLPLPENLQVLYFWVESYPASRPDLVGVALVVMTPSTQALTSLTPIFLAPRYEISVPEDTPGGTQLIQVEAFSIFNHTRRLQYTLAGEEWEAKIFKINDNGWVGLKPGQMLDHEANHTHFITVMVMDDGDHLLQSSVLLEVRVSDVNDNPPEFKARQDTYQVPEDAVISTPIIRLLATDADSAQNSQVRYELVGGPNVRDKFLVTENGWLLVAGELDRETREAYQLTVRAVDGGEPSLSTTSSVFVTLPDVADDPPVFLQQHYIFPITAAVSHRARLGTVVAHSRDLSANISYCILPGDYNSSWPVMLAVDSVTGEVYAEGDTDPVAPAGRYQFSVRASHAGMQATARIEIVAGSDPEMALTLSSQVYLNFYYTLIPPSISVAFLFPQLSGSPTFSLLDSSPPAPKPYFGLNNTTGELTISDIRAGLHVLNISVSNGYYVNILVRIVILDNTTLDNAVGVRFGGVTMERFLRLHLGQFLEFVADVTGEDVNNVLLCGIQNFMASGYARGVELALAVKTRDLLQEFFQTDYLRSLLLSQRVKSPLLYNLSPLACSASSCPNLQICRQVYQVEPMDKATPTSPVPVEFQGVAYHSSHVFSATHKCSCPAGYSVKDLCSSEVNECETHKPCLSGAECVDRVDDYICVCPQGVAGKNCSDLIPTSDTSCSMCDPTHCLYNGSCCATPSGYTCTACPWGEPLSGPNCELVVVSLEPGSYVVLAMPTSSTRLHLSLAFATVSSTALLLYAGSEGEGLVYIVVEVILGQVKVGVSHEGVATVVTTDSVAPLNDGEWHNVTIELRDKVRSTGVG